MRLSGYALLERFSRDYKALSPDLRKAVDDCLVDLLEDPIPAARRAHCVERNSRPKVYTADVTPNKSHKISFHIDADNRAVLRRIGTHKAIDRAP